MPSLGGRLCAVLKQIETLGKHLKTVSLAVTRALNNLESDGEIEVIKTRTEKNTLKYNYKRIV